MVVDFVGEFEQEAGEGVVDGDVVDAVLDDGVVWWVLLAFGDRVDEGGAVLGLYVGEELGDFVGEVGGGWG